MVFEIIRWVVGVGEGEGEVLILLDWESNIILLAESTSSEG